MAMAQAYTRVPKMAMFHINISRPLGSGACHEREEKEALATRDNFGSLAIPAHFYMLHPTSDAVFQG